MFEKSISIVTKCTFLDESFLVQSNYSQLKNLFSNREKQARVRGKENEGEKEREKERKNG